jgi:Histidine phosphatase superfamily (branch 1)
MLLLVHSALPKSLVRAFVSTHRPNNRWTQRSLSAAKRSSLPPVPENAHRIVLMRHGESEFNNANIFTGWCDVALTPRGRVEAAEAGEVFRSHDLTFRQCYCSLLSRAIVTAQLALEAGGVSYTPLTYDWRLNERHYGELVLS